jgi:hypothetical protein
MQILIVTITVIVLIALGIAVCIVSDRIEQRRRLKRLRKRMLLEPDLSDQQFAVSLSELERTDSLEMRRMLALMLGLDALKIRPEWRFREERDLKNMDIFIFHAFASRYAPGRLRGHRTFEFPTGTVTTVGDLFVEASRLHKSG